MLYSEKFLHFLVQAKTGYFLNVINFFTVLDLPLSFILKINLEAFQHSRFKYTYNNFFIMIIFVFSRRKTVQLDRQNLCPG